MAAILQLRRGTSPSTTISEPYFNTGLGTIQIGDGSTSITLVKIGSNTGNVSLVGNLSITGNLTVSENITFGGSLITLGDANTDNIVISGELSSSLVPNDDAAWDLGSSLKRYKNLYVVSASIDNISLGGSNIVSGSSQIIYSEISSIPNGIVSGSSQIDLTQTTNYSTGIKTRLNVENVISGSSQIDALGFLQVGGDGVISGSSQVQIDSVTGFTSFSSSVDNRLDELESDSTELFSTASDHESRIDVIEGYSSSLDSRLDYLEGEFSTSVDNRIDLLESFSSSLNDTFVTETELNDATSSLSASLTITDVDFENRINTLETTFSSSVDSRLDNLESTGSNHESRIDGLETYTGSNDTLNTTQNNRLSSLETYTGSNDSNITQLFSSASQYESFSSSIDTTIKTKINIEGVFSSSAQVNADSITNFDTNVKDKLNSDGVISGSTQVQINSVTGFTTFSSSVDGRLDTIEGSFSTSVDSRLDNIETYTSSLKDAINVSGQDLTIYGNLVVQGETTTLNTTELLIEDKVLAIASGSTTSAAADGAGLYISGANASILWNDGDNLLEINQKVSSSIGFKGDGSELTGVTAAEIDFDDITSKPTLLSGSDQVTQSLDSRYLQIDGDNVVSSSSQINISGSSDYIVSIKSRLDAENVHSSSYLGTATTSNLTEGINLYYTDTRVKTKLNVEGIFSSSAQVNADTITNFDSNVLTYNNSLGLISGSSQVNADTITNFDSNVLDKLNVEGVLSGSDQVTQSLDTRYLQIGGDGVISGSSQVQIDSVTGFTTFSSSVDGRLDTLEGSFSTSVDARLDLLENFSSSQYNNDSQSFDSRLDFIESYSASLDSRLDSVEGDQHTHSNKANLDEINQDLATTDSPSFIGMSLTSLLPQPTSSIEFDAVFLSSSNELTYRTLGNAILYNVTSSQDIVLESGSIAYASDNLLTAGAVKKYVDWRTEELVTAIGAADITSVTANAGLTGGGLTGAVTLSLDTGSVHFNNGVVSNLVSLNSFTQSYFTDSASIDTRLDDLESFSSSLDSGFVTEAELASATGSLINSIATKLNTGSYNTDSASFDSRIDVLESDSISQDGRLDNLELTTASFDGRLDNLELDSASQDSRLDNIEGFTSSIDTTIKTKLNIEGVISGSDQLTSSYDSRYVNETDFTSFSSSVDGRLDLLETNSSSLENIFEEKASGTHTLVSGSSQVLDILSSLNTYTGSNDTTNTTQNSRLDQLSTYTGSNETAQSAQNSRLSSLETKTGSLDTEQSAQNSRLSQIELVTSSLDSTYEEKASGTHTLVSGSDQLTGSLVDLTSDQTISGTKTFNDIVVNGTGSFAYITSVSGTAKIIGDAFIVLNTDTPTSRYAGLSVYDSGSTLSTASFYYDGETNDWGYEYSSSTGVDYAVTIFGPEYNTKGNPSYLTTNKIPKAVDNHHLNDSNITDTGTLITLGSNSVVNGTFYATGTTLVSGSPQIDITLTTGTLDISSRTNLAVSDTAQVDMILTGDTLSANLKGGVVSGSSQINFTELSGISSNIISASSDSAQVDMIINGGSISANLKGGVVSGSSQVDLTATTNYSSGIKTRLDAETVISGSSQVTLSSAIGYGSLLRSDADDTASGIITFSNTTQSTTKTTGAVIVTGGVGISKTLNVGEDVVAYASSDRRLKDNITPITNPLQKINQIGGYSFVWNENQDTYKGKDYGVIAQEIEEILPELVDTRENGYKAVKYDKLVSLLIEGIKELSSEVEELKRKLNT